MTPGVSFIYFGRVSPKKKEKPMMKRFRVEFKLTNCKFEIPTAVTIPTGHRRRAMNIRCVIHSPNMTMKTPPVIGSGMLTNTVPILPQSPKRIMITAAYWMTRRLAT